MTPLHTLSLTHAGPDFLEIARLLLDAGVLLAFFFFFFFHLPFSPPSSLSCIKFVCVYTHSLGAVN